MSESTTFSHTEKPHRLAQQSSMMNVAVSAPLTDTPNGYAETFLYNATILAIHLNDLERSTLDMLVRQNYDSRMSWADHALPMFMLVTFDESITTITPYAREKAREMNMVRPELSSIVAVVVPPSVVGQILKVMLWSMSQAWHATTLRVFVDADEALVWLKRQVDYAALRTTSV